MLKVPQKFLYMVVKFNYVDKFTKFNGADVKLYFTIIEERLSRKWYNQRYFITINFTLFLVVDFNFIFINQLLHFSWKSID